MRRAARRSGQSEPGLAGSGWSRLAWRSGGSSRRRWWRPERPPPQPVRTLAPYSSLAGGAAATAAATAGAAGRASPRLAGCPGARSLRGAAAPAAPAVAEPWGRAAAGRGAPFPAEQAPRPGADAALCPHTRPLRAFPASPLPRLALHMPDGAPRLGDALQQPRRPGGLRLPPRDDRSCPRRRGQPAQGQDPGPPPAAVRRL